MKKNDTLNAKIVTILKNAKNPVSTREIAMQTGKAWHTILTRCLRLQLEGKVKGFKAGNMHLWHL